MRLVDQGLDTGHTTQRNAAAIIGILHRVVPGYLLDMGHDGSNMTLRPLAGRSEDGEVVVKFGGYFSTKQGPKGYLGEMNLDSGAMIFFITY